MPDGEAWGARFFPRTDGLGVNSLAIQEGFSSLMSL